MENRLDQRVFGTDEAGILAAAIHDVASRARGDLARATSLRAWARRHPWIAVAVGLTSGFIGGELLSAVKGSRSKGSQSKGSQSKGSQPVDSRAFGRGRRQTGWLSREIHWLFAVFRRALGMALVSAWRQLYDVVTRRDNWFPRI
jgi:hypothetical protein